MNRHKRRFTILKPFTNNEQSKKMKNEEKNIKKPKGNGFLPCVSVSLIADFLKYAIDETTRISGDHDGNAGTLYIDDNYEKIAEDYISICNER